MSLSQRAFARDARPTPHSNLPSIDIRIMIHEMFLLVGKNCTSLTHAAWFGLMMSLLEIHREWDSFTCFVAPNQNDRLKSCGERVGQTSVISLSKIPPERKPCKMEKMRPVPLKTLHCTFNCTQFCSSLLDLRIIKITKP